MDYHGLSNLNEKNDIRCLFIIIGIIPFYRFMFLAPRFPFSCKDLGKTGTN